MAEAVIDYALEEEPQDGFELARQVSEKSSKTKEQKIQGNILSKFVFSI